MKVWIVALSTLSAVGAASGAEPLYVPHGDYAFQTPIPESSPLPVPQPQSPGEFPLRSGYEALPLPPDAAGGGYLSPMPSAAPSLGISGKMVKLYPHVHVRNPRLKHPHGVTEVVELPNPWPLFGGCEPVYVEICVPPGCQPVVDVGPRGQRYTYRFPGYQVQVTSLRGVVTVDYDRLRH